MYLSAANRALGAARGQAIAVAGRSRSAASKKATQQIAAVWTGALPGPPAPKSKRKTKR
jgi:hypothetical protein